MNSILQGITRPGSSPLKNPPPHATGGFMNRVKVRVTGPDGVVKQETPWVYNVANTYGLASLASRVGTASGAGNTTSTEFVSAMRIGTDTTAATSTDASLNNSTAVVYITQASLTKTNLGNRTVEYQATFASNNPAGGGIVINEVGLYCNSTANSQLLARSVLGTNSVNKGASDVINVSYDTIYTTSSTGL